jgi:hypothetical protein
VLRETEQFFLIYFTRSFCPPNTITRRLTRRLTRRNNSGTAVNAVNMQHATIGNRQWHYYLSTLTHSSKKLASSLPHRRYNTPTTLHSNKLQQYHGTTPQQEEIQHGEQDEYLYKINAVLNKLMFSFCVDRSHRSPHVVHNSSSTRVDCDWSRQMN